MTFVSETALRGLLREALAAPSCDPTDSIQELGLPVLVNPSVDSTLAGVDGDVVDVQFVPHDKVEFEVAVKALTRNLPDEVIASLYAKVRDAVSELEQKKSGCDSPGDAEDMKKKNDPAKTGIEEMVRKVVKKMLSENEPIKHLSGRRPTSKAFDDLDTAIDDDIAQAKLLLSPDEWDDTVDPSGLKAHHKDVDRDEGIDVDPFDTSDVDDMTKSDWDPDAEAEGDEEDGLPGGLPTPTAPGEKPEKKSRKKPDGGKGAGFHGKDFESIANELGIAVSGAKRLEHVALRKVAYMVELGEAEAAELVLDAVDDYITKLAKSGELSEEEVSYMYQHADLVGELDGFREYLHAVIRKEMKRDGKEFWPKLDDKGKPVLDKTGAEIHRADKDSDEEV